MQESLLHGEELSVFAFPSLNCRVKKELLQSLHSTNELDGYDNSLQNSTYFDT